jgi:hypothetical protein
MMALLPSQSDEHLANWLDASGMLEGAGTAISRRSREDNVQPPKSNSGVPVKRFGASRRQTVQAMSRSLTLSEMGTDPFISSRGSFHLIVFLPLPHDVRHWSFPFIHSQRAAN